MFVKICGITNEDDALLAVAMGADALGFVFAPSQRQVAPQQVYDITRRLPPEILTIGVFRDELPARVIDTVSRAGLKVAQNAGWSGGSQAVAMVIGAVVLLACFGLLRLASKVSSRARAEEGAMF